MQRASLLFTALLLLSLAGCRREKTNKVVQQNDRRTKVSVDNPDRHYYPIIQGEPLEIFYKFKNTGTEPLIVDEIQTSCGCLVADKASYRTIRPGKTGSINLKYNTNKNIGFVRHYVEVYSNVKPKGKIEISFDVHVVPDASYLHDYEELYTKDLKENSDSKGLLKEDENQNRYYLDSTYSEHK